MRTILLVDDEPLIRWAVRAGLEAEGYRVIEAGTAREAEDILAASVPGTIAVAVLDLKLPDSDDLTLLRRVRSEAPDCRVIIMTAYGSPALLAEALKAGAVGTVSKPFDLPRVVQMIRQAAA
jgi:DNA-binding NtrC family response regulator